MLEIVIPRKEMSFGRSRGPTATASGVSPAREYVPRTLRCYGIAIAERSEVRAVRMRKASEPFHRAVPLIEGEPIRHPLVGEFWFSRYDRTDGVLILAVAESPEEVASLPVQVRDYAEISFDGERKSDIFDLNNESPFEVYIAPPRRQSSVMRVRYQLFNGAQGTSDIIFTFACRTRPPYPLEREIDDSAGNVGTWGNMSYDIGGNVTLAAAIVVSSTDRASDIGGRTFLATKFTTWADAAAPRLTGVIQIIGT